MTPAFLFGALLSLGLCGQLVGCGRNASREQAGPSSTGASLKSSASGADRAGAASASASHRGSSSQRLTNPTQADAAADPSAAVASAAVASAPAIERLSEVRADQLLTRIRGFRAKATLVNAWASWCGPCRDEVPMLESMSENLSRDGIRLVLISMDEPEDRAKAEAFLRSIEARSPAYLAARPLSDFKEGLNPRWPGMIPATFLFDGQGKLRYFWGGPVYEHEIMQVLDGLLAGKPIDGQADFTLAPGKTDAAPSP